MRVRRSTMRASVLPLLLAACAAGTIGPAERDEAALARELAGRVAGAPQSCVSVQPAQNLQPAGRDTLVYRSGGTVWINRPRDGCVGLRPLDTLIVETHGSQY